MGSLTGCKSWLPNVAPWFWWRGSRGRTLKLLGLLMRFLNLFQYNNLFYWLQMFFKFCKWVFLFRLDSKSFRGGGGEGKGRRSAKKLKRKYVLDLENKKKKYHKIRGHYVRKISVVLGKIWSRLRFNPALNFFLWLWSCWVKPKLSRFSVRFLNKI